MNNKYKRLKLWAMGVSALVALVLLVSIVSLNRFGDGLQIFTYTSYISSEYVPNYKQNFGQWPANLDDLPDVLESEIKGAEAHYTRERLGLILNFHRENYKGMSPLNKDAESFDYALLLESEDVKCESTLESGHCE